MFDDALARVGALGFGLLIGWYTYFVNRYRKGDVTLGDLTTLVGVLGGGSVTSLFGADKSALFGAYGLGLAGGFFGYFAMLTALVRQSAGWGPEYFLDGRRPDPPPGISIPDGTRAPGLALDAMPPPGGMQFDAPAGDLAPRVAAPGPGAAVVAACEQEWDGHSDDCSGFVRAVAARLGVAVSGDADAIVAALGGPGWTPVPDGVRARAMAEAGMLVVAGMRGAEQARPSQHGHVVVVVPGVLAHGVYPTAYWGTLGRVGAKAQTLNYAWTAADRDRITYAAHAT